MVLTTKQNCMSSVEIRLRDSPNGGGYINPAPYLSQDLQVQLTFLKLENDPIRQFSNDKI